MRSNFVRVSTSALIVVLLAVVVVGGVGGRNESVASAQTMAGTMAEGAESCPPGAVSVTPGMFEQMAAQMMGTMPAGAATSAAMGTEPAAAPTMAATGAATMAAGGMQEVALTADLTGEGCLFAVTLAGAAEKPGPGDTDGAGSALVLVDRTEALICYSFTKVTGITLPAAAAHIHQANVDAAGPVVVPFKNAPNAQGTGSGCITGVPENIVSGILATPGNYYVNVHTSDFGGGAVRGQLPGGAG